jgi:hypothetical protein
MKANLIKYWPLIAGVILVIIAFRGCNPLPTHNDEKKASDTRAASYQVDTGRYLRVIADLSFQKDSLQTALDTTRSQLVAVRQANAGRMVAVQKTLASGNEAARRRDTAAILINWDSLRAQVIAGLPALAVQDSLCQETINTCMRQGMVKDSLTVAFRTLWLKADSNYAAQLKAYNGLYGDYKKASNGLKFNKTLSRGLAVALLVAGAKIFIFNK